MKLTLTELSQARRISFCSEPNALASGLASGFRAGVVRLSDILLRPDASANG